MLGGKGCGIDAWPVVGMMNGGSLADECGFSSALVLSLYFPYPFCPCISHTHWISCFPYFPYRSCPLFLTIMTLVHSRPDAESCCSMSHPVAGC